MQIDIPTALALTNLVAVIVSAAVTFTKLGGRVDILAQRLSMLENDFTASADVKADKRLALIEQRQGTHGEMLATLQSKTERLARGEGWVTAPRHSIDGEYS